MSRPDSAPFKTFLDSSVNITLLLSPAPSLDTVATALSLKLSLDQAGKSASVVCPDPMTVEFNRLVGVETVSAIGSSRNLVIAFPGQTENVDKVTYNLDDKGDLNLVISPKPNMSLDYKALKFIPGTSVPEAVILVGSATLPEAFAGVKTFSLPDCETAIFLMSTLNLPINPDIASNLLAGLDYATNNFQSDTVTADTFEAASLLMRQGAKRGHAISAATFPPGSIPTATPTTPAPDWYTPKVYQGNTLP